MSDQEDTTNWVEQLLLPAYEDVCDEQMDWEYDDPAWDKKDDVWQDFKDKKKATAEPGADEDKVIAGTSGGAKIGEVAVGTGLMESENKMAAEMLKKDLVGKKDVEGVAQGGGEGLMESENREAEVLKKDEEGVARAEVEGLKESGEADVMKKEDKVALEVAGESVIEEAKTCSETKDVEVAKVVEEEKTMTAGKSQLTEAGIMNEGSVPNARKSRLMVSGCRRRGAPRAYSEDVFKSLDEIVETRDIRKPHDHKSKLSEEELRILVAARKWFKSSQGDGQESAETEEDHPKPLSDPWLDDMPASAKESWTFRPKSPSPPKDFDDWGTTESIDKGAIPSENTEKSEQQSSRQVPQQPVSQIYEAIVDNRQIPEILIVATGLTMTTFKTNAENYKRKRMENNEASEEEEAGTKN